MTAYTIEHVERLYIGTAKYLEIVRCMEDLRPELQAILDVELEAGNRVLDASRDWPDAGSVFVTLLKPFQRKYETVDPVRYDEPGDPHYWKADYSCGDPVHVLAC